MTILKNLYTRHKAHRAVTIAILSFLRISYNMPGIHEIRERRQLLPTLQYLKAAMRAGVPKAKPHIAAQGEYKCYMLYRAL